MKEAIVKLGILSETEEHRLDFVEGNEGQTVDQVLEIWQLINLKRTCVAYARKVAAGIAYLVVESIPQ